MNTLKLNCDRAGCKDVFKAFLVEKANYDGELEIPIINGIKDIPNKLISFIETLNTKDYDQWVHFYIDDFHFEKIWTDIRTHVKTLKKFKGVILPDFSIYRDMPIIMQYWNIYRSRAIGTYLQSLGIKVIVNVRYGDDRTYECCCSGVPHNSIIAIGTNGCIKNRIDRKSLEDGFDYVVENIKPKIIVIYGSTTKHILDVCNNNGIEIITFRNEQFDNYGGK